MGTRIVGACPEMLNGIYGADDTNYNVATFDSLEVNTTFSISSIPNQTVFQSTATPSIPFTISATTGKAVTVTAKSSNTNLVSVQRD